MSSLEEDLLPETVIAPPPPRRNLLPAILYGLTWITTTGAGAMLSGQNPLDFPGGFLKGLPFSFTLMAILTLHEAGHYLVARWYNVPTSWPYFIPAPTLIGTFGAIIRTPPSPTSSNVLFDIAAAGPVAGLIPAIIALIAGVHSSTVVHSMPPPGGSQLELGESLLFKAVGALFGPQNTHGELLLSPIAFAGWMGLLITSLNLIPAGQLDGGHVFYAFFGKRVHRAARPVILSILLILGWETWHGWIVWAVLLFIMGAGHPPGIAHDRGLSKRRKILGVLLFIVECLIFVPSPLKGS